MIYKELIDSIKLRHETLSITRGLHPITFRGKVIFHWILIAEREIQMRTQILIGSKTALMIADNTGLGLPADFGKEISVIVNKTEIDYIGFRDFKLLNNNTLRYALADNDAISSYDTNWLNENNKVILIYPGIKTDDEITINYYKAIIDSTFDETLTIKFPINYINAIELKVLSLIFPDYINKYENEIRRLKEYSNSIPIDTIGGDYGI